MNDTNHQDLPVGVGVDANGVPFVAGTFPGGDGAYDALEQFRVLDHAARPEAYDHGPYASTERDPLAVLRPHVVADMSDLARDLGEEAVERARAMGLLD